MGGGGGGGGKSAPVQHAAPAPVQTTEPTAAPAAPEEGMTDEQKAARAKQKAAAADAQGRSGTLFGGATNDLGVAPTTKTVLGG